MYHRNEDLCHLAFIRVLITEQSVDQPLRFCINSPRNKERLCYGLLSTCVRIRYAIQVAPVWFNFFSKTTLSFKLLFELKTKETSNANGPSCVEAGAGY